jgi:hypothetical protein
MPCAKATGTLIPGRSTRTAIPRPTHTLFTNFMATPLDLSPAQVRITAAFINFVPPAEVTSAAALCQQSRRLAGSSKARGTPPHLVSVPTPSLTF